MLYLPLMQDMIPPFVQEGTAILGATGASSYVWNTSETMDTIIVTPPGTTTYTVTGTNANSCSNIDQVTVTVNPLPTPVISGTLYYCAGSNTILDAGSYVNFLWSTGAVTQTINATTVNNPYSVTVTDANGCNGTSTSMNVFENSLPIVNAGNDVTICSGSTILTASGSSPVTYIWDNGLGTGNSFSVSPPVTTTYSVTATNVNGCTNSDQTTVTVSSGLSPTITGSTTFCTGGSITLDAGGGYFNYWWSNGASTQTISATTAGTYNVTVSNGSGCYGEASVIISEYPLPIVNAGNDVTVCGGSTTLTASGSGPVTYQWDNGIGIGSSHSVFANNYNYLFRYSNIC